MNPILVFILRLLLILLSYAFVGWVAFSIFADLKRGSQRFAPVAIPPITLIPNCGEESQVRQFSVSQLMIGRDPASDFYLDHPTVSLRHCRLSFHHKQWWAEDLDSTNGSYLNDSQIETPIALADGDELRLGEICIKITIN